LPRGAGPLWVSASLIFFGLSARALGEWLTKTAAALHAARRSRRSSTSRKKESRLADSKPNAREGATRAVLRKTARRGCTGGSFLFVEFPPRREENSARSAPSRGFDAPVAACRRTNAPILQIGARCDSLRRRPKYANQAPIFRQPSAISGFGQSDRSERFRDGLTSRGQRAHLPQVCDYLLWAIPFPLHPDVPDRARARRPRSARTWPKPRWRGPEVPHAMARPCVSAPQREIASALNFLHETQQPRAAALPGAGRSGRS